MVVRKGDKLIYIKKCLICKNQFTSINPRQKLCGNKFCRRVYQARKQGEYYRKRKMLQNE